MESLELCCHAETPAEQEARQVVSILRSKPVNICWHRRRRVGGPQTPSTLAKGKGAADTSPFPKSWSINYSGRSTNSISNQIQHAMSEESYASNSVFSTVSQEQKLKRDANGNCIKHRHIQLAKRRQTKSHFLNIFSKHKNQSDDINEWETIHMICPECEKEQIENSKTRYQYKPIKAAVGKVHQEDLGDIVQTHVPFPATLTLIDYRPQSVESAPLLALRIRSEPITTEQTMHLSSCTDNVNDISNGGKSNDWVTPDGALDSLLPADSNGNIIKKTDATCDNKQKQTPTKKQNLPSAPYQIMERIIPLSSIDHVSRGGDAWDILRQSTGENDFGCNCGVKIHGFSDRLLRFDVVNFDDIQSSQANSNSGHSLRFSFAPVDLGQFSVTDTANNDHGAQANAGTNTDTAGVHYDNYTTDNVIAKLNTLVSWDRESREASAAHWMSGITNWLEEICSLGVTQLDGADVDAQNDTAVGGKKNPIV